MNEAPIRIEKGLRWLPVTLNRDEMIEKSKLMAKLSLDRVDLETEKSEVTKSFADRIKNISGEISKLTNIIDTGIEDRHVTCESVYDYEAKTFYVRRIDNGAILEQRPLRQSEGQIVLQTGMGVDANIPSKREKERGDVHDYQEGDGAEEFDSQPRVQAEAPETIETTATVVDGEGVATETESSETGEVSEDEVQQGEFAPLQTLTDDDIPL